MFALGLSFRHKLCGQTWFFQGDGDSLEVIDARVYVLPGANCGAKLPTFQQSAISVFRGLREKPGPQEYKGQHGQKYTHPSQWGGQASGQANC
jgi:hypothetical protein